MDCPKCVGKLQKKIMEDIEIDTCFVCEGIWFDANELEDVVKRDSHNFKFLVYCYINSFTFTFIVL